MFALLTLSQKNSLHMAGCFSRLERRSQVYIAVKMLPDRYYVLESHLAVHVHISREKIVCVCGEG